MDKYTVEQGINDNFIYAGVLCRKFIINKEEIELLRSAILEKCWTKQSQFSGGKNEFKAWLYVIVRNTCITHIRYNKTRGYKVDYLDISGKEHPITKENQDNTELLSNVMKFINERFNKKDIDIFTKKIIEGYKYRELTEHFGLEKSTIRVRIHLMRKEIKKQFKQIAL